MEHFAPVVMGVVLILGLIGFSILRKHLADEKRLRLRQMIHQERMAAMDKEVQVPALDETIERSLLATASPAPPRTGASAKGVLWLRLTSLCFGWFLLLTGLGIAGAFSLVMDRDMREIWAVGFIPAMAGIGLLLFYYLSSDYGERFARFENDG